MIKGIAYTARVLAALAFVDDLYKSEAVPSPFIKALTTVYEAAHIAHERDGYGDLEDCEACDCLVSHIELVLTHSAMYPLHSNPDLGLHWIT